MRLVRARRGETPAGAGNDRIGSTQYTAIRYTERLGEIGAVASIGSVGDSDDNALAQSVIGLFKTELHRRHGPWRNLDHLELAILEWVDWFQSPPPPP